MALDPQDYVLGKGEVWFSKFKTGTQEPEGFRWLGNVTDLNMNFASDQLEHFASYRGVKEKDAAVDLQVNRTGQMTTDNIDPKNVSLFFFGDANALTVAASSVTGEALSDVMVNYGYQLGATALNPTGNKGLKATGVALKKGATTFVEGTDYDLERATGWLHILSGGSIVDGDDLTIDYDILASTRTRIISGSTSVEGSLKFISRNPTGSQKDYLIPWIKVSPNGDYNLITDQWQTIPFKLEILKRADREALYVETRPVTA